MRRTALFLATVAFSTPALAETFTLNLAEPSVACKPTQNDTVAQAVEKATIEGCSLMEGVMDNGPVMTAVCGEEKRVVFGAEADCEAFRAVLETAG